MNESHTPTYEDKLCKYFYVCGSFLKSVFGNKKKNEVLHCLLVTEHIKLIFPKMLFKLEV